MEDNNEIRLLTKSKKTIFGLLFSRLSIIAVLLLIQLVILLFFFGWFKEFIPHLLGGTTAFTIFMVLYVFSSDVNPTEKMTWLILIMIMPITGGLFYIYTKSELGHRLLKKRCLSIIQTSRNTLNQDEELAEKIKQEEPALASLNTYVNRSGNYPICEHTNVKYFPLGEEKFKDLLVELNTAQHFIFMEYFIIEEGKMWGQILEILAKKAKEGVDVRAMYDGTCEFSTMPNNYPKLLETLGIKCKIFAPATMFLSTHYNYRDHRKICVIDGKTAFNGGVNLADEYINAITIHGHWKDTAVKIQGQAVDNFTVMFLNMWNMSEIKKEDYEPYLNHYDNYDVPGYVMPYGDNPMDNDKVGESVYMDILNRSNEYVYIMSPYLILDGELESALKYTAERGVDIRLILPGVPDKLAPYALAKSHYKPLLEAGVKIYEYTPGFVHAKVFLSDDKVGVVGTINLDYRSLYHHFECATYMYKTECLKDIKDDYLSTLVKCHLVNSDDVKKESIFMKIYGFILKVLAPLM